MTRTRPRILLIDDDRTFLRKAIRFLRMSGLDSVAFSDPVEALAAWRTGDFQVVVTDVDMPRMNGIDVLRSLRGQDAGAQVIVLTGFHEEELRQLALAEGAAVFLTKPLDLEYFLNVLSEILASSAEQAINGVPIQNSHNRRNGGKGEPM